MSHTAVTNWAISSQLILDAAEQKNLRTDIIDANKNVYVIFHPKTNQPILFKASATIKNNTVSSRIAGYKDVTYEIFKRFIPECPLPTSITFEKNQDLQVELDKHQLQFPLVVKPIDGLHGDGVVVDIQDMNTLEGAVQSAFEYQNNNKAIIQKMLVGDDYRVLVVNYKVVAVSKRIPAFITGNGSNTIEELVAVENNHPLRGDEYQKPLSKIILNQETTRVLAEKKLTIDSVVDANEIVYLKNTANLSTGGVAIDFTDEIHPTTKQLSEKIAQTLGLGIVAIDYISPDISQELDANGAGFIEINDTPGIRMHHHPYQGKARDAATAILESVIGE